MPHLMLIVIAHVDDGEPLPFPEPGVQIFRREVNARHLARVDIGLAQLLERERDDLVTHPDRETREQAARAGALLPMDVPETPLGREELPVCAGVFRNALHRAVDALLCDDDATLQPQLLAHGAMISREFLGIFNRRVFVVEQDFVFHRILISPAPRLISRRMDS